MPKYVYRENRSDPKFEARLNDLLDDAVNTVELGDLQTVMVDVDVNSKEVLDDILEADGFEFSHETLVDLDGTHPWGRFTTTNEPTLGLLEGDYGYDLTKAIPVYFDGSIWIDLVSAGETNNLSALTVQTPFGGYGRLQNFISFSEEMDQDPPWTDPLNFTTTVANNAADPQGGMTADTVTWDTVGTGVRHAMLGTLNSTTYTVSVWGRNVSGNADIGFDLHDGGSVIITFDSTLRRHVFQVTSGVGGSFLDLTQFTTTGVFEFWGWQVNDGTDVYPYTHTRSLDFDTQLFGSSTNDSLVLGGATKVFTTDDTPLGNETGIGGDVAIRSDGTTSGISYNAGATANTDEWREVSAKSDLVTEIWSLDDLPDAIGSVITLPSGMYLFKADVDFGTNRILILSGSSVQMLSDVSFQNVISYSGTDTFITGEGPTVFRVFYPGITFFFSGDGATFIDITGSAGIQFSTVVFEHPNGGHLGDVVGSFTVLINASRFFWIRSGADGWVTGFNIRSSDRSYFDVGTIESHANATTGFINIKDQTTVLNVSRLEVTLNSANASLINVDPTNTSPVNIDRCVLLGGVGNFFKTGITGTFTAVADAAIGATAITSVTDSGGIARFNFTGPTVFVNQEVITSTFTTNPDYNDTKLITSTDGTTFFEIDDIDFGSDETGSFLSNSVTLTDTATALVDGDTILIDTTLSTDYDGGSEVFNQLTNSFQVNKTFTVTQSGTWDTGSLTEDDKHVETAKNGSQQNSKSISSVFSAANVAVTSITGLGTFDPVNLGTAFTGQANSRFKLINATTGEVEYTGLNPITGAEIATLTVVKSGSAVNYKFRIQKITGTGNFDAIEVSHSVTSNSSSFTLLSTADLDPGDTFRVEVEAQTGTDNLTVTDFGDKYE